MADFNWVTPRIATGAALSSPDDVKQIVASGVTFVVDARAEFDDGFLFAGSSMIYLWNPTPDDGVSKPVDYWKKTLEFALPLFARTHQKGLFHCAAGCNRGPSNALAVMVALGWTKEAALAAIRSVRPGAAVNYADNAASAVQQLGYV